MKNLFKLHGGFYLLLIALCFTVVQSCSTDENENNNSGSIGKTQTTQSSKIGGRVFDLTFSIVEKDNVINYANNMSEEEKLEFIKESENSGYKLTANDEFVVNRFAEYYVKDDFDTAIKKLQEDILTLDLDDAEFARYNQFVNVMIIMEQHEVEKSTTGKINKRAIGCAVAVAANAVSTLGLYACAVPTPALPAGCGVAIAGKLLSYAGMLLC
ncbi:hypothetical protein SAMN05421841_3614 [Chryseobacterium wanjuense]|jgi:hypothetical protein|uniref:Lipoprotein n=1 Tax=Chryseobacterium wanjuense TaxID=356305 RepID=A0A1I0S0K7_9FLAO|nr:hypothetical protein [Chryseobacterium wanjuense]SEW47755.1 hypothetical protein SAMN05421841_3614 [Chryseobacterium wanjuense]